MLLADRIPLGQVLGALAVRRPVFHSEADFQLEFAWQVRLAAPDLAVRLETRPLPGVRLDLLLTDAEQQSRSALELKYLTRAWSGQVAGEWFELKTRAHRTFAATTSSRM